MNVVIATTASDPFAGVFWKAYRESSGPVPSKFYILKPRTGVPVWQKVAEPFLMFGFIPTLNLVAAKYCKRPLFRSSREQGLHLRLYDIFHPSESSFHHIASLNQEPGASMLRQASPDFLVSVGSPEIFRRHVLQSCRTAALNVHNGRLPGYRGMFGTFWEVFHREPRGAVTIHVMERRVDVGSPVATAEVDYHYPVDFLSVMIAKKRLGGRLLAQVLNNYPTLRVTRDGATVPDSRPEAGYYQWPHIRQSLLFAGRRYRR